MGEYTYMYVPSIINVWPKYGKLSSYGIMEKLTL